MWAGLTFTGVKVFTGISNALGLPVISTGRPFSFYREVFFGQRGESEVLEDLADKRVLDIGCGLTPFTPDSMFQACYAAGVEFYGVDPKLDGTFEFGRFDRVKVAFNRGHGLDPNAPGEERRLAIYADDLPFEGASVDLILSSWALFVWIDDPQILTSVFHEAVRVLKPSGEMKIYPTPNIDAIESALPNEILNRFEIRQVFLGRMSALNLPPAYRTTFRIVKNSP